MLQRRSQTYVLCKYNYEGTNFPVYAQKDMGIPTLLTISADKVQYGMTKDQFFFVHHDTNQRPFQERFETSAAASIGKEVKSFLHNVLHLPDFSWIIGNYLQTWNSLFFLLLDGLFNVHADLSDHSITFVILCRCCCFFVAVFVVVLFCCCVPLRNL